MQAFKPIKITLQPSNEGDGMDLLYAETNTSKKSILDSVQMDQPVPHTTIDSSMHKDLTLAQPLERGQTLMTSFYSVLSKNKDCSNEDTRLASINTSTASTSTVINNDVSSGALASRINGCESYQLDKNKSLEICSQGLNMPILTPIR